MIFRIQKNEEQSETTNAKITTKAENKSTITKAFSVGTSKMSISKLLQEYFHN